MLSDEELFRIGYDTYPDGVWLKSRDMMRKAIAAHTAKLRQGVELPEPAIYADNGVEGYTQDQLLQYGDARDQAGYLRGLETALLKVTGLSVDVERCKQLQLTTQAWEEALDDAAAAIESLMGGE